jgi:hypothetical protein
MQHTSPYGLLLPGLALKAEELAAALRGISLVPGAAKLSRCTSASPAACCVSQPAGSCSLPVCC